ncbi:MAG: peroxiredoxin [Candidatus Micrarchaeia archaeon]
MIESLTVGEKIPEIKAKAYFPKTDSIEEVMLPSKEKKWTILTFYPGDFTFVCATDIEELMKRYEDFKKNNAEIYTISTDSIYSHKAWVETSPRVKLSAIPMLEDFKKEITKSMGFLNDSTGAARRGVVIVDPEGVVQYLAVFNDALGKDVDHIYNAFLGLKYLYEHKAAAGHACIIPANWKPGKPAMEVDLVKDIGKL